MNFINTFLPSRITILVTGIALSSLCGCQKAYEDDLNVELNYYPNPYLIENRPSAFEELGAADFRRDWGKELEIGRAFAKEQDYYRAITAFKRALFLCPTKERTKKLQIEYSIVQAYYLAYKYQEAIEAFEASALDAVSKDFPAFHDLLIMLYDCYQKIDNQEKAAKILYLLEEYYPCEAPGLRLSTAFIDADLPAITRVSPYTKYNNNVDDFLCEYQAKSKSPGWGRLLQTLFPGAGYYYVGQKNAAITSLMLNGLFTWAAYQFFKSGNIAAGIVTTSLETGWYFGGINGVGIAAREYNERLYETNGREFLRCHSLFPVLMIQTSF